MADAVKKLPEIELFTGAYWFTLYENGKGTLQGPFVTKYEAEKAQKAYRQENACLETQKSLTPSTVSPSSSSASSSAS